MKDDEIPFLVGLRQELVRAIADGNSGRSSRRWSPVRGLRRGALTAIVLILAAGSVVAWLHYRTSASQSQGVVAELRLPNGVPFPNAQTATLASATQSVPFAIYRPQDVLASDQSVVQVWVTPKGAAAPQVAIDYNSGIRVYVMPRQFQDVLDVYRGIINQTNTGSIQTINGFPALVLPGNIPGHAPTVDTVIRGVEIQIVGGPHDFSLEDLVRIAASIQTG